MTHECGDASEMYDPAKSNLSHQTPNRFAADRQTNLSVVKSAGFAVGFQQTANDPTMISRL